MKKTIVLLFIGVIITIASVSAASAITIDVKAYDNSLMLTPLDTGIDLVSGDLLSMSAAEDDTWSAGANDRTSNANGLGPGNTYGGNYGLYAYAGFSFYYGSLVGRIDSGDYFFVGTDFDQTVGESGRLYLMYWDSNYYDNSGEVAVTVDVNANSVPEPATMLLLGMGLAGLAGFGRKTFIKK